MDNRQAYIALLKKSLLDWNRIGATEFKPIKKPKVKLLKAFAKLLGIAEEIEICKTHLVTYEEKLNGTFWNSAQGDTMIGLKRLENIEFCFHEVIKNQIPGDFIETGVWRGGATIFMKGLLSSIGDTTRKVWVADSFEGLPEVNKDIPFEVKKDLDPKKILAISEEQVRQNFEKYNLLDDNVCFLKGWFKDTLPVAPIEKLAILRLDGDLYESTMDALVNLYPKLSVGGYLIVDDFSIHACKRAIFDYRKKHAIKESMIQIDWTGVYWKKLKEIS